LSIEQYQLTIESKEERFKYTNSHILTHTRRRSHAHGYTHVRALAHTHTQTPKLFDFVL